MTTTVKDIAKKLLPRAIQNKIVSLLEIKRAITPAARRHCNICGYKGFFKVYGRPLRTDARCPKCSSLERHRLFVLALERGAISNYKTGDLSVLHFAPEPVLEKIFRQNFSHYDTADLFVSADLKLNMEDIDLPNEQYDVVIANHVLEHVDDRRASQELARILKKDGLLVCQVPVVEGWDATYENSEVKTDKDRWLHFGQGDHVRYYGKDFRSRISAGGFQLVREITSEGIEVITHGLLRGEKVFVFRKIS